MSKTAPIEHLPLFDQQPYGGTPPHVKDSDTSWEAALRVAGSAGSVRRRVFRYITSCLHYGTTDEEIEIELELRHQTASARRRELVILGLVIDSGKRRPTSSGCTATVWVEKGEEVTD